MSDIAIRVEGLGKQYRIGGPQARYKTLRESLAGAVQSPIRRAGRLLRGEAATDHQETIWALKDVSFEVKHGEVLGIIGRNGAGKSTLLKILSRITAPTEGTVDLYGRVGSLLEVGTGFHPELTGRENIYLNGAILGMKRAEIDLKFDEMVDFAELEKFLDTPVKHYSSGMYVRLAFAVAAHLDPEILLVDEVLAVGDVAFQKKCLSKMGEVAGEGRTVLFVSHNMIAMEGLCKKSLLMAAGSVSAAGDTESVIHGYLSSTISEAKTPIALRVDRQGTGRLVFDDITVDDRQIRDRSLHVDLSIRNLTEREFPNVLLSIVINDHLGRRLTNLVNYVIDRPIFVGVHGARVRITMKNVNLVPGTYTISPFVSSDKQNTEVYDWVMDAAGFDVPDYDYYHKGHAPYTKGEIIYLDYDYENI